MLKATVLLLVVTLGGCRGRAPSAPVVDWRPRPGEPAEGAAVLMLDENGVSKVVCLPIGVPARQPFPALALQRIWDVGASSPPVVAATTAAPSAQPAATDDLVLLSAGGSVRRLATGVATARFSPDGTALAYQIGPAPGRGAAGPHPTSHVLELATDKVTDLGALVDPRWDAAGKHVLATRVRTPAEESAAGPGGWKSLRVRWERASGAIKADGPGSAQIPAPLGDAVAWSERQLGATAAGACSVVLRRHGGVRHSVVGSFCAGVADERAVRWSGDGRWLAFAHPGPIPRRRTREGFFVDVVSVEGGRHADLTALHALARPDQLAIATAPGSVWFDWSPSARFLVVQDGAHDMRIYDFKNHGTAGLGKGRQPMWSPGGTYLLILDGGDGRGVGVSPPGEDGKAVRAFVLAGVGAGDRRDLGPARDARWLPAQVCGRP